MEDKIIGRNPVMEAIKANREIEKIFIKKGGAEGSIVSIIKKAKEKGIIVTEVDKQKLDAMADGGNHQGIIALVAVCEYVSVKDS